MTETYYVSMHVSIMATEEWSGQCGRVIFIINNADFYFYGLLLAVFGIQIFVFIY